MCSILVNFLATIPEVFPQLHYKNDRMDVPGFRFGINNCGNGETNVRRDENMKIHLNFGFFLFFLSSLYLSLCRGSVCMHVCGSVCVSAGSQSKMRKLC